MSTVSATLLGSSGSTGVEKFDVTLQNLQFRVQLDPRIMKVAMFFEKQIFDPFHGSVRVKGGVMIFLFPDPVVQRDGHLFFFNYCSMPKLIFREIGETVNVDENLPIGSFFELRKEVYTPQFSTGVFTCCFAKKAELLEALLSRSKSNFRPLFQDPTSFFATKISANCDKNTKDRKVGQQVDLMVHTITTIGIMTVLDNRYYGMMYLNETYQKLFIGDTCKGYIMRIRKDGKIDMSMKNPGYSSVPKSAEVILYRLNKSGRFIPCHDKSSPEEIRKSFSMSKKKFKRAVGNLYKKRLIELKDNGIGLLK